MNIRYVGEYIKKTRRHCLPFGFFKLNFVENGGRGNRASEWITTYIYLRYDWKGYMILCSV